MPTKLDHRPSPLSGSQRKLRHEQVRTWPSFGIPDFETPEDCAKRQEKMIRRLAGAFDKKFLRDLGRCTQRSSVIGKSCCGACHFAMRRHRLAIIPQACELFDEEEEIHQVGYRASGLGSAAQAPRRSAPRSCEAMGQTAAREARAPDPSGWKLRGDPERRARRNQALGR